MDFGDGIAVSYVNLSSMEDGIKHVYHNVGIFRVTVQVDNSLGSDSAVLYLHVTCMLLLLLVYDISYILCPLKNITPNQVSRRSPLVILAGEERRLREPSAETARRNQGMTE